MRISLFIYLFLFIHNRYDLTTDQWQEMNITVALSGPARLGSAVEALSLSSQKRILIFSGYYLTPTEEIVFVGNELIMLQEVSGKIKIIK